MTNNQSKYEEGERIPFHFRDPIDGYVELDLIPSQDMCSKGWTLKSDKAPLRVSPIYIYIYIYNYYINEPWLVIIKLKQ